MSTRLADAVLAAALDAALTNVDTVSLHTADPGAAGTLHELTSGIAPNYSRQAITFASATAGDKPSNLDAVFTATGGDWPEVTHIALWNSGGGPDFIASGKLTVVKQIDDGETLTLKSGDVDFTGAGA